MKKIMIYNRKGGVGKTTSVVNIGACLARIYGKRVLIVDCDPQSNATRYLTSNQDVTIKASLEDVFCGNYENVIHKVKLHERGVLQNTPIDLIGATRNMEWNVPEGDEDLHNFLDFFATLEKKYDICLFDCPPHPSAYVECIMHLVQFLVVPVCANLDSINGYDMVLDELKHMREESQGKVNPSVLGVMINEFNKVKISERYWSNQISSIKSMKSFKTKISLGAVIDNASADGRPVIYHAPSHKIAQEYVVLCKELLHRIKVSK